MAHSLLLAKSTSWIPPIWLISSGVALGLVILVLLIGVIWFIARNFGSELLVGCRETFLMFLGILSSILLVLSLTLFFISLTDPTFLLPIEKFANFFKQVPVLGEQNRTVSIPAEAKAHLVHLTDFPNTLIAVRLSANANLILVTDGSMKQTFDIEPGAKIEWTEDSHYRNPLHYGFKNLAVTNNNDEAIEMHIYTNAKLANAQVWVIPITAGCLIAVVLFYLLMRGLLPKISAIAYATTKEAVSQPIFLIVMIVGALALLVFIYLPYGTFGEDIKMLKKNGLPWIVVLSMVVALWTASTSIADELEGRTALTVLSKPITRRTFIIGKFFGIAWMVAIMFITLGLIFMATVSYKVIFDAPGAVVRSRTWEMCYAELISVVPGLVLGFMETIILASISVAISTRLPMIANMIICVTIYALGHLVPLVVNSSQGEFAIVRFMGQLIATVLPVLDHFQTEAAVVVDGSVPLNYLLWAGLYSLLYCTIAMLVALAAFEDRDLA